MAENTDTNEIIVDNDKNLEYVPDNNESSTTNTDESVEDQARALGWKPQEEYSGKPGKWADAEEYLEVHGKNNGALRRALDQQAKDLAELRREIKGLDASHKRIFDLQLKKAKDEHAQQIAFLKSQRSEARRTGDYEAVDELETQLEEVQKRGPDLPDVADVQTQNTTPNPNWRDNATLAAWADKNPWFEKDEDMSLFAGTLGVKMRKDNPDMDYEKLLEKVSERVRKAFPTKFAEGNRPNRVEGATPGATSGASARNSYAALPKEAKQACDEEVASGNMTQKAWIELYHSYDDRRTAR